MKPIDVALAIGVQILWALGFVLGKPVVAHFPPMMMMAMVYALTALCLARYLWRIATPFKRLFLLTLLIAPVQACFMFYGLKGLPASTAMLVLQSSAPFTVLFGWLLLGERPSLLRLGGMTIAFLGVVVVAGAPEAISSWWPVLLVVIGSACWSIGQAMARGKVLDDGPILTAGIAINAIPQALLASALLEHGQIQALTSASLNIWGLFLAFALGGFVLAYSLWYRLLRRYRVDQVIPFTLLMPIAGVVSGAMILGESVSSLELLGGIIIMVGLSVVIWSKAPAPALSLSS
jgi:O-acetylserine/cysteine efflux transporter